ncbi:carotenoid cleavage dioxygenase [Novosphingobium sp. SG751A]|uniref:carotenoid oxygenase family protein n=1 Tax=Novosphingobium sp. SG751A TaxID=2587000 RepID=UPI001554A049|nr:carotenoid oxygenase family protein [Novosphingobium sp. SG751A]NOW47977.1 carotenoid cleavage dioxygenase [Novosphingobium sp. SG751A]
MVDFSASQSLKGFFAPVRFEAELRDCVVTGTIPPELDGAFYRMHGDWLYPPAFADEASLSADGYISRLRFRDGRVDYRGRYVKTDRYQRQIAAGRQLYGYYRNPYTDDPSVRDVDHPHRRTAANTTPVVLAGRLYATKEEGLPYEIDPNTLDTLGESDFAGAWHSQTFSAHPKYDPATGETIAYGFESKGLATTDVHIASFDRAGNITWRVDVQVPYSSMLHDMALTKDYVIIPGGGTVTSIERLQQGRQHWAWDSKLPSYHLVVPRGGRAEDARVFNGPERSIVHTANAWNDGPLITMDAPMASGNTWPWFEDVDGGAFDMNLFTIRRITLDMRSHNAQAQEQELFPRDVTSFTRIDDRYIARRHRYIWVQYVDPDRPFDGVLPEDPRLRPVNCYGRFDVETGEQAAWFGGPECVLQEPVHIPRAPDAPEGEGWIIGTAHNLIERRSEIVILDAMAMVECARVILPFRNAFQVHGTWASAGDLALD